LRETLEADDAGASEKSGRGASPTWTPPEERPEDELLGPSTLAKLEAGIGADEDEAEKPARESKKATTESEKVVEEAVEKAEKDA
jgi:hypothetical protein